MGWGVISYIFKVDLDCGALGIGQAFRYLELYYDSADEGEPRRATRSRDLNCGFVFVEFKSFPPGAPTIFP